jgi:ABC-type lipoprotein release transport system permease subunit
MNISLLTRIAWRNLWRHKGKSIVIGVILAFGAVMMTVGNGMISGMETGLSQNIIRLFTGDIVIVSNKQKQDAVLLGSTEGKPLPVIENFPAVLKALNRETKTEIRQFLPVTAGYVFILNSESKLWGVLLLGVDIAKYRKMFPESFTVVEGRMFKPGERGVLVSEETRKNFFNILKFWTVPQGRKADVHKLPEHALKYIKELDYQNKLLIMGASTYNSVMDVSVPVTGIIRYKSLNKVWGTYCIADIESFREAHYYVTGADAQIEIPKETKSLFATEDLDQIFSPEKVIDHSAVSDQGPTVEEVQANTTPKIQHYYSDSGAYNLVFLFLKPGISQQFALKRLNAQFRKNHLNVRAISWKSAMGSIGNMAMMFKVALNTFIMFIFFVAMIIIANTLSMAALERVPELGMMRAIGAPKGFLGKMFVYETGILSFFFGGSGIIVGWLIIYLLRTIHITTTNEMLQLIFGGDRLSPLFTGNDVLIGIIELGVVTFLSILYPLRLVGKIVPLDAIAKE